MQQGAEAGGWKQLPPTCCRCSGGTMRRDLAGGPLVAAVPAAGSGMRSGQERTAASASAAISAAFAAGAAFPGLPPALQQGEEGSCT
jgi:hypothetical protein